MVEVTIKFLAESSTQPDITPCIVGMRQGAKPISKVYTYRLSDEELKCEQAEPDIKQRCMTVGVSLTDTEAILKILRDAPEVFPFCSTESVLPCCCYIVSTMFVVPFVCCIPNFMERLSNNFYARYEYFIDAFQRFNAKSKNVKVCLVEQHEQKCLTGCYHTCRLRLCDVRNKGTRGRVNLAILVLKPDATAPMMYSHSSRDLRVEKSSANLNRTSSRLDGEVDMSHINPGRRGSSAKVVPDDFSLSAGDYSEEAKKIPANSRKKSSANVNFSPDTSLEAGGGGGSKKHGDMAKKKSAGNMMIRY